MSFDWKLYIDLADELVSYQKTSGLQDAYYRTAISRSYYGVFCIARNLLIKKGPGIPYSDEHRYVREEFKKSPKRIEKQIGEHIGRLWRERKDADYEEGASIDRTRADTACKIAKKTLSLLNYITSL